jgi:23S rRNA pseudouridine2604 synthase
VPILDTITNPCRVTQAGRNTFRIVLTQGLNRQIRRMCEHFDYTVRRLQRVRIMHIRLGPLPVGEWRNLTPAEIKPLLTPAAPRPRLSLRRGAHGDGH